MAYSPLISVIMPVFNGQKYIREALHSILDQKYEPLEIIVVDDGSTDNSKEVVEKFKVENKLETGPITLTLLSQANAGPAKARNTAIKQAKGELIAFLDSDDLWPNDHLALLVPYLAPEMPYDWVVGYTNIVEMEDGIITEPHKPLLRCELISSALYRSELFSRVGLFDESLRQGEDTDWILRLGEHGARQKIITATTHIYRRHATNMTNAPEVNKKGALDVIKNKLARQKERLQGAS